MTLININMSSQVSCFQTNNAGYYLLFSFILNICGCSIMYKQFRMEGYFRETLELKTISYISASFRILTKVIFMRFIIYVEIGSCREPIKGRDCMAYQSLSQGLSTALRLPSAEGTNQRSRWLTALRSHWLSWRARLLNQTCNTQGVHECVANEIVACWNLQFCLEDDLYLTWALCFKISQTQQCYQVLLFTTQLACWSCRETQSEHIQFCDDLHTSLEAPDPKLSGIWKQGSKVRTFITIVKKQDEQF